MISFSLFSSEFKINEEFEDLEGWQNLTFPKIEKQSEYTLVREGNLTLLKAESNQSASGLLFTQKFNVYEWQNLSWRWKIDSIIEEGDGRNKEGDDYAIRIYVLFEYDPENAGRWQRTRYNLAKLLYGEYPPDSGLNYVWANRKWASSSIPNAHSDKSIMVAKDTGTSHAGEWVEHTVNILEDYTLLFNKNPPQTASIAVMADTDNTGSRSTAYIDYIRLSP
jgi:hypothetical protein